MSFGDIDISEEDGVRYLHFGSEWVQGAMRIRRPYDLELAYTREMMAGLLMRDDALASGPGHSPRWPRNALLIGLGAGSLTKFMHRHLPQTKLTVVEINPAVWAAAQQFFKLPDEDARLRIEVADGVDFITQGKSYYDYILIDGYDEDAKVGLLDSLPFYQACWSRLSESGLLVANMFGRSRKYGPALARLSEAFDQRTHAFPACESGNVVAFAARGEAVNVPLPVLRERARILRANTGLDLRPTVTRLEQAGKLPDNTLGF